MSPLVTEKKRGDERKDHDRHENVKKNLSGFRAEHGLKLPRRLKFLNNGNRQMLHGCIVVREKNFLGKIYLFEIHGP
jgi:hypothetical protein